MGALNEPGPQREQNLTDVAADQDRDGIANPGPQGPSFQNGVHDGLMRSSVTTMSAAARAAGVLLAPSAIPTSARRMAGASLAPSPVIATTFPGRCRAATMRTFCTGVTRAKMAVGDEAVEGSVIELRKLGTCQNATTIGHAELRGNGARRARMIACDHDDIDARTFEFVHGGPRTRSHPIGKRDQATEVHVAQALSVNDEAAGLGNALGHGKDPIALAREQLHLGLEGCATGRSEKFRPPARQPVGTAGQQDFRSPLDAQQPTAIVLRQ